VRDAITAALAELAAAERIHVLYACESGSRAWGFASPDSDWDVRLLYVHEPAWYLSVFPGTDHLGRMLPGDLDLAGWDLRKALGLFAKSNAPLFEQLGSAIVYADTGLLARLRALVPEFFNPIAAGNHYLGLARRMREGWLDGRVTVKKLFYVLRPLAACRWIERSATMPPTAMAEVVEGIGLTAAELVRIGELRERKIAAREKDTMPVEESLVAWIDGWLADATAAVALLPARQGNVAVLDRLLADVIQPDSGSA
jgi:predicted nucleotidyltransferase